MMAGGELFRRHGTKLRHFIAAPLVCPWATGAETAARWRRHWGWRLTYRDAFGGPHIRIRHRDGLDQQRGIRVRGHREQLL